MMALVEFGKPPACVVLDGADQLLVSQPSERGAETRVARLSGGRAVVALASTDSRLHGFPLRLGMNALAAGVATAGFAFTSADLHCAAKDVVMIGDDAEADVGGAMAAGLMGVLVQTGKYRPGQEAHLPERPTLVAESLKAAVDSLLD